ncbi:MAG: universal stress protein, partial [Planctomycetota bacterium]
EAEGHMVQGATVDTIVAEAEGRGADLVVAGTRGLGKLAQLLVGSTTDGLLKRLSVPLLVVPPGPDQPA